MMVAILVIGYVLVLRYLDQKNRERDRLKAGAGADLAPMDYAALKQSLADMSERLAGVEKQYRELAHRMEVSQ
jgi:hypothetical protein